MKIIMDLQSNYDSSGINHSDNKIWIMDTILKFAKLMYAPLERIETVFFNLKNLCTIVNQLSFFAACDNAMLTNGKPASCLFTLMFYNVVAYSVAYIKELIDKENWCWYVKMTKHSQLKHLAMSATKIVLEWTKAVTFIISLVFFLLVFGLEQGLQNYRPTIPYMGITWLYYMLTEKVFVSILLSVVSWFQAPLLDRLEELWVPVIFCGTTASLSFLISILLVVHGMLKSALILLYLNVYLKLKQSYNGLYKKLMQELAIVNKYREANVEELSSWNDVCAVCLLPMKRARITPCHHIFHSDCLRNCLKASDHCPLCKRHLIFY